MVEVGAFLSSEEHGSTALVAQAEMAEKAGLRFYDRELRPRLSL